MQRYESVLAGVSICATLAGCQASSRSTQYLHLLDRGIVRGQEQLPVMTDSAAEVARRLIAGGKLWAAGPQKDFQIEAYIRAGGLMCVQTLEDKTPGPDDAVIYGVAGPLGPDDLAKFRSWRKTGAYVIAFSARPAAPQTDAMPDVLIDNGPWPGLKVNEAGKSRLCPTDTVVNAVNLWVWTAELTAACTRQGRMPTFYKSVVRPGGRDRNKPYHGTTFHEDMKIDSIPPGVLGKTYIANVRSYLAAIGPQHDRIATVARWWRQTDAAHTHVLTLGHLFPDNLLDPRAPQRPIKSVGDQDPPLEGKIGPDDLVLFVGYQEAPAGLVKQASAAGCRLCYFSVRAAEPAMPDPRIVYINPAWPIDDACVTAPGYDIPILPASGVVNAAIYWSIVAEATGPQPPGQNTR